MKISEIQKIAWEFDKKCGWDKFPSSLIFIHLFEELGEISRYILFDEGYKDPELGHTPPIKENKNREFAQAFLLFLQLVNKEQIDLEEVTMAELKKMETRFDTKKWSTYMKKWSPVKD